MTTDTGRELSAVQLAVAVSVVAVVAAAALVFGKGASFWLAVPAAWLVVIGVSGGYRWAVGTGALAFAGASIVATNQLSTTRTLLIHAVMVTVCIALLIGADISFSARRRASIDPVLLRGLILGHVVAVALGVLVALSALSVVLAIDWPTWLIVFSLAVLVGVAGAAARFLAQSRRKRLGVTPTPPPPRQDRGIRQPPPPAAATRKSGPPPPPS